MLEGIQKSSYFEKLSHKVLILIFQKRLKLEGYLGNLVLLKDTSFAGVGEDKSHVGTVLFHFRSRAISGFYFRKRVIGVFTRSRAIPLR